MKLLFAFFCVIPGIAQAGEAATVMIEGENAKHLMAAFSESEFSLQSHQISFRCESAEEKCKVTLIESKESELYLYQNSEARLLYSALSVAAFETRLGKIKVYNDPSDGLQILCSFSPVPAEEPYSCTVKINGGIS